MYCAKCGCKIQAGENVCSNCRAVLNNAEYCGGFWGLVGQNIPEEKAVTVETIPDTEMSDASEEGYSDNRPKTNSSKSDITPDSKEDITSTPTATNGGNNRLFLLGLCACTVFFMLLSIVQSIRLVSYKAKYETMINENDENDNILKNNFDGIRKDIGELKNYLARIEQENKQEEVNSEEVAQPNDITESTQQSGDLQSTETVGDSENSEENDYSENSEEEYQEAEETEMVMEGE